MKDPKIAEQVHTLIEEESNQGKVLSRSLESVRTSLLDGDCAWIARGETVVACAILTRSRKYLKIGSLVVHKNFRGNGLASEVVRKCVELARESADQQVICAIAGPESERVFLAHGFVEHPKEEAGIELWGDRTREAWLASNRKFLVLES